MSLKRRWSCNHGTYLVSAAIAWCVIHPFRPKISRLLLEWLWVLVVETRGSHWYTWYTMEIGCNSQLLGAIPHRRHWALAFAQKVRGRINIIFHINIMGIIVQSSGRTRGKLLWNRSVLRTSRQVRPHHTVALGVNFCFRTTSTQQTDTYCWSLTTDYVIHFWFIFPAVCQDRCLGTML